MSLHEPAARQWLSGILTFKASLLQDGFGARDLVIVRFAYLLEIAVDAVLDGGLASGLLLLEVVPASGCHLFAPNRACRLQYLGVTGELRFCYGGEDC